MRGKIQVQAYENLPSRGHRDLRTTSGTVSLNLLQLVECGILTYKIGATPSRESREFVVGLGHPNVTFDVGSRHTIFISHVLFFFVVGKQVLRSSKRVHT